MVCRPLHIVIEWAKLAWYNLNPHLIWMALRSKSTTSCFADKIEKTDAYNYMKHDVRHVPSVCLTRPCDHRWSAFHVWPHTFWHRISRVYSSLCFPYILNVTWFNADFFVFFVARGCWNSVATIWDSWYYYYALKVLFPFLNLIQFTHTYAHMNDLTSVLMGVPRSSCQKESKVQRVPVLTQCWSTMF